MECSQRARAGAGREAWAYPGVVVRRLAQSRVLRWAFGVVALAMCGWALTRYWSDVRAASTELSVGPVLGAAGTGVAAIWCSLQLWRGMLGDLGSRLSRSAAAQIFLLAQFGKYVPGSIWPFIAQTELGKDHGVPRTRSATVAVLAIVVSLVTGLLTAAVTLPLASRDAARTYWWALAGAPVLLLLLLPPVLNALLERALRLARRPALERRLSARGVATAVGWALGGWALFGLHVWFLARDLGATGGASLYVASTGAFALAWSVGFLVVFAPAGAGVREVALAAALAPRLDTGGALVVVIASRLLLTLADLAGALVAMLLSRHRLAAVPPAHDAAAVARRAEQRPATVPPEG